MIGVVLVGWGKKGLGGVTLGSEPESVGKRKCRRKRRLVTIIKIVPSKEGEGFMTSYSFYVITQSMMKLIFMPQSYMSKQLH